MKTLAIGSILVLFAIMLSGVSISPAEADHAKATVDMPAGTGIPGCEETDMCFVPSEVTIDVGGEVTWTNNDNVLHFVTAGDLAVDPTVVGFDYPNGFDSGIVNANQEFTQKFEVAGTYPYFCTVHPWMKGVVYVEGASSTGDGHDGDHGMMNLESLDQIMATIEVGDAMQGSPLSIDVEITDMDGGMLEHVNFKVMATQGGEVILNTDEHAHEGMATVMTAPLAMAPSDDMPVDITVELIGFGIDEITGPSGQLAVKQVVPEFGTIAMMILGIAIISIIAVTAKTRVIPKI